MKVQVVLLCAAAAAILSACSPSLAAGPATPRPQSNTAPVATSALPTASQFPATPAVPTPRTAELPVSNWDEFSFEQVTTVGDQSMQSRWSVKQDKVRIEAEIMGQPVVFVGDQGKKIGYQWLRGQNQLLKMSYDEFEQSASAPPDLQELSRDAAMGTLVGTGTADGQACDVYEIAGSAATLHVWVSRINSFPIKSEITTSEGTVTTEYRNLKQGGVGDDLFEPPPGMKVVDSVAQLP